MQPSALRITLVYLLFGILWILFSDRLLYFISSDPQQLINLEIYKGWAFIGVTALLLYSLINRSMKEQKRITEILNRSERKFHTLLDRATDAIFVADLEGRLLDVNQQACNSVNYSREELLQFSITDVDPDFSIQEARKHIWPRLFAGKTITIESRHRRKDGSFFPVEIHVGSLELDGKPVVLGIARDISERKQAERAMEQAFLEWSTAMDASDDVIYILDLNRRLLRANTSFYRMAGLTPEEAKGRHIEEIVHPQGEKVPCPVCQAQEEKRETILTMEADHPDNPIGRPLEISVKIVRDRQGNPLSILMSLHDLTNSRQELEEKASLESQLKQAQKMEAIGTLAGGIAHDFNNILTAILGYADLAKERIKDAHQSTQEIDEVIKGGCRARDLVKYILTFARQGQQIITALLPAPIIKESLKLLRASIPTTIEIRQEIDDQCGIILADPSRLHQVMMNLCTNALHAMENEKGTLYVSLRKKHLTNEELEGQPGIAPGFFVELTVSDTGHGMDQQTIARIFDPYFTTKEFGKGTGFGLALVHGIVRDCNGFIKVDSEVGKGSAFKIYFPVAEQQTADHSCETARGPLLSGHERILVVDDEKSIIDFVKAALEGLGYQVTSADSAAKILDIFKRNPEKFDLLITDQTMPGMTGLDLARQFASIRPELPVILCSGYSSAVNGEKVKGSNIKVLAAKPFTTRELAGYVRQALDDRPAQAVQ